MARIPKPWFWKARKAWYVTIDGTRHPLGDDKEQAYARFHQMMANPTRRKVRGDSVVSLCDLFLSWTKQNRSEKTYHWYRQFLQAFVNSIPANLTVDALKPYHVQRWLDATPGQKDNTKRGKLGAVKRAVTWARKQGYTDHDPLAGLERPAAGRRETVITPAEFERMLEHCPDEAFRMLLTVAWANTPAQNVVPRAWLEMLRALRKDSRTDTARDFFRHLAGLGGFLMRKRDGEPGWITIWRGTDKLLLAIRGHAAMRKRCG